MRPLEHDERICFFDIETGGFFDVVAGRVKVAKPLTQIAAIAVDRNYRECETLEIKTRCDEADADRTVLNANHYNAEVWKCEALPPAWRRNVSLRFFASTQLSIAYRRVASLTNLLNSWPTTLSVLMATNSRMVQKAWAVLPSSLQRILHQATRLLALPRTQGTHATRKLQASNALPILRCTASRR